jgi:hypothetical protein
MCARTAITRPEPPVLAARAGAFRRAGAQLAPPSGVLPPSVHLPVRMLPQPDETTCGPTCLQAVYRYWGADDTLAEVVGRTGRLDFGGTLAVFLGCDALSRGWHAIVYTYNLLVFDPTWFGPERAHVDIAAKLERQRAVKDDPRLQAATTGYLEFLARGGRLRFTELSRYFLRALLRRGLPIITGLSSTYLYRVSREIGEDDRPDDVAGTPSGHFVVIAGYDWVRRKVLVADPYGPNPYSTTQEYWIDVDRVINAVLLGIVTHDANLLVVMPPGRRR